MMIVGPLQILGYTSIEKLKAFDKSGKLHQEMMGYRKNELAKVENNDDGLWVSVV
jgi:hypothetical protein